MPTELRIYQLKGNGFELRSEDGQPTKLVGYGAIYYDPNDPGSEYELARFGNYSAVERLMPGCFDRAVREDSIVGLMNHDPNMILGRCSAGTMRCYADSRGLRYEIDIPNTSYARDLVESIKRGDISGSSFSFDYISKDVIYQQEKDKERDIINVRDVRVFDTGPVSMPAYTSTTAGLRSQSAEDYRKLAEEHLARKRAALRTRIGARITELEI